MGIQTNKAKVTIDFMWAGNVGDGEIEYQIKYHHTDDFGPTVSISTDGGSEYYGFPADMFSEIVDFLRGEKMLKPSTVAQCSSDIPINKPAKKAPLPIPVIENNKKDEDIIVASSVEPFEVSSDQVQSFADTVEDEEQNEDVEMQPPPKTKKKVNTEIDAQQAALERQAAAERANANKDKRRIRRDITSNEE